VLRVGVALAAEMVLQDCTRVLKEDGGEAGLDSQRRQELAALITSLGKQALRAVR
jgi:hypothetical protein